MTPSLDRIEPQLATAVERPPSGSQWVYEIKLDGYRLLASLDGDEVRLFSRNQGDWTHTFPWITAALRRLALHRSVIDGELCYVTDEGITSFEGLQRVLPRGHATAPPVEQAHLVFFAFDLLFHEGEDLRGQPLLARKERLRALLESGRRHGLKRSRVDPLAYCEHMTVDGHTALTQARRSGLAGLVAKRADAPYQGGPSRSWLKLKCRRRHAFVIVGMIGADGGVRRKGLRSLVLALREPDGYRYCGTVGTGLHPTMREDLSRRLSVLAVDRPPVRDPPRVRDVTWVLPELECEVEVAGFTAKGRVRRATFKGLRLDPSASQAADERRRPRQDSAR